MLKYFDFFVEHFYRQISRDREREGEKKNMTVRSDSEPVFSNSQIRVIFS